MFDLQLPIISPKDQGFIVAWSTDNAYAELEFYNKEKKVDWFIRDMVSDISKGSVNPIDHIPFKFLSFVIKHFIFNK